MNEHFPTLRVARLNGLPVRADGDYVLYWMIAFRRTTWNYSLDRALGWAQRLQKPLVVLEALRCSYAWASDRLHRFVIQGMRANAARFAGSPVTYYPYVEPKPREGKGLMAALAEHAAVVITDDYPCFFLPQMTAAAARQCGVRMEAIDSNGILPVRATDHDFPTAYAFRRFLQKTLPAHLEVTPSANPLARLELPRLEELPAGVAQRWPAADCETLSTETEALARLPIDHTVGSASFDGGEPAARTRMREFLTRRLSSYAEQRNHPDKDAASGLSPYLHFGHVSSHEILAEIIQRENWTPARLAATANGAREGWWGLSAAAEAFLDQLVTWRELGFNFCVHRPDYDQYESLPDWARQTLDKHARDRRAELYTPEEFERAATHDPLWNAAQWQLVRDGWLHNYLRMLWGKKILHWSATPREALATMTHLNNKYAVDGRDPNSYSGIFWTLGRYDRPWGPERPIFGTIRYMTSENTARKLRVREYLRRYGSSGSEHRLF